MQNDPYNNDALSNKGFPLHFKDAQQQLWNTMMVLVLTSFLKCFFKFSQKQ